MAMNGSVDFTIRANDLTSKPTKDIVNALEQLVEAQKDVARSADDLTTSSSRLTQEQKALAQVSTELDRRLGDVSKYQKNKEALEGYVGQLKEAQNALDGFRTKFFEANETGSKDIIRTATDNLKVAQKNVETLRGQIAALQSQQSNLQNRVSTRSGLDVTRGDSAREILESAAAQARVARDQNIIDQQRNAALAEEVRLQKQAEAAAAARNREELAFQQQASRASEQNRRNEYEVAYGRLLDERDAKLEEERRIQDALTAEAKERAAQEKIAADQLERYNAIGQRALTTLKAGRDSRAANAPGAATTGGSAASGVDAALDPLKSQTSTLSGVEGALKEVQKALDDLGTKSQTTAAKVKTLEDAEEKLAAVNRALTSQAKLADTLTKQNAATDQAQASLAAAEAEVERLATQIRNATQADEALVAALQQAQGRLASTSAAARTQAEALERVRAQAAAAGINVNNLAAEEQRLTQAAQQSAQASRAVGEGLDQASGKAGGLGAALERLGGSGRQSLSLFQRIRGEVLALTASFVGVQAGVAALGSVLDVVKTDQAVRAQIAQTTNSPEEQAKQYAFLRSEAERTGFSFETVSKSYALMARQALEYGLAQNTVNKLFADGLTVGRSFNQSGEQLEGTFTALGQIFDKTTIQSEEFKKQLSNQGLAGLFPTLARVMQDQGVKSIQDVQKAMENAQIPAAEIVKVFEALAEAGDVAFKKNMGGYAAELNNFKTRLYEVQLQFAGSGFLEGVTKGLNTLSEILSRPETQENLKKLGELIGDIIAGTAEWASDTDNLKGVLTAFEVYISAKLLITVVTLGSKILAIGTAGAEAAAGLTAMGGASAVLGTTLGAATTGGVVTAVIALGTALGFVLDKIPAVREQTEALANMSAWEKIKKFGPLAGLPLLGQAIGDVAGAVSTAGGPDLDSTNAKTDKYLAQLNEINRKRREGIALSAQEQTILDRIAEKRIANDFVNSAASTTTKKGVGPDNAAAGIDTQRKIAESQIDATNKAAERLRDAAEKKELKSRKDYLELYTKQNQSAVEQAQRTVDQLSAAFDKTGNAVDKAALDSAKNAQAALLSGIKAKADADYAIAGAAAGKKQTAAVEAFETKRQSLHEQTNALILSGDTKLAELTQKQDDDNLKARLAKVDSQIAQEYAKYEVAIRKNNDLIASGRKLGQDTSALEADNAALKSAQDRLNVNRNIAEILETQKFFMDTSSKAEDEINRKIQLRAALLSSIQAQQKAGTITPQEASNAAKTVDQNTLDGPGGINDLFSKRIATNQAEIEDQIALGNATSEYTEKLQLQNATLEANRASIEATRATTSKFEQDINNIVSGDLTEGISGVAGEIANLVRGTESWGDAWRNVGDIVRNTIAGILIGIGEYIIKQQILNLLKQQEAASGSGGGSWGGLIRAGISYLGGSSAHTGAIVGAGGVGGATPRNVDPSWFVGAPRYHTGGMVGLQPDEFPIIAKKNEEVLTENDPRNRLNQQNTSSQVGAMGGTTNVHFHADAESFFSAGLNTRAGDKNLQAYFTANRSKYKKLFS